MTHAHSITCAPTRSAGGEKKNNMNTERLMKLTKSLDGANTRPKNAKQLERGEADLSNTEYYQN